MFDVATNTQRHAINAYNPPEPSNSSYDPDFHPTEHTYPINSLTMSSDGKLIASSSGGDKTIRLWDVEMGKHLRVLTQEAGSGSNLKFSPDGKMLACVKYSEFVLIYDVITGQRQRKIVIDDDDVNDIALSPDWKTVATAEDESTIRLWDVQSGTLQQTLIEYTGKHHNFLKYFNSVVFSPDGSTLASGNRDGTILLWDATVVYHQIQQSRFHLPP